MQYDYFNTENPALDNIYRTQKMCNLAIYNKNAK